MTASATLTAPANELPATEAPNDQPPAPMFKLIPDPQPFVYDALKEAIRIQGVLQPILTDEDGNIIDGFQRQKIADELGLKDCPRTIVQHLNHEQKREMVFSLNIARRNLNRQQRYDLLRDELLRKPSRSAKELGRMFLLSHNTAQKLKEEMIAAGTIADVPVQSLRGGQPYIMTKVYARNEKEGAKVEGVLQFLGVKAPEGDIPINKLYSAENRKRQFDMENQHVDFNPPEDIKAFNCDFRELEEKASIAPESVDLIVTDPPYSAKFLPLIEELGAFAARTLKPGHVCAVYCSTPLIPQWIDALQKNMKYLWLTNIYFVGRNSHRLGQTKAKAKFIYAHRPVLLFSKGKAKRPEHPMFDAMPGKGKEKDYHPWQQGLTEIQYYVRMLSQPGELVVDPFLGSGTSALACFNETRKFIGCDVRPECLNLFRRRMKDWIGDRI